MKKDFLSIEDVTREEVLDLFDLAVRVKKEVKEGIFRNDLEQRTMAMVFEKPSLRTRVSFETGMTQLGGHAIYLGPNDISLGKRESVPDIARNLDRMTDIIMARTFSHKSIEALSAYSRVPVINALSDYEHPCQVMADYLTIYEHKGRIDKMKFAFLGAGNNMSHSLMLMAGLMGMNMTVGCAPGYEPLDTYNKRSREMADKSGALIEVTNDPIEAIKDADIVYTDVWASMGEESEREARAKAFGPYQVNAELFKHAKNDALFMHCLPAHRGDEVTDDVIDSKNSVVFDEAENRLHAQKAVILRLMKKA